MQGISIGSTSTDPSFLTYFANVCNLAVHIPTAWKSDAIKTQEKALRDTRNNEVSGFWVAQDLHHAIIELLLERKDLEEIKMPRSLVE
jgi:hypothetical protein